MHTFWFFSFLPTLAEGIGCLQRKLDYSLLDVSIISSMFEYTIGLLSS